MTDIHFDPWLANINYMRAEKGFSPWVKMTDGNYADSRYLKEEKTAASCKCEPAPDDADMCWKCFGEFNAAEYDNLKQSCEGLVKILDDILFNLYHFDRLPEKCMDKIEEALSEHRKNGEGK